MEATSCCEVKFGGHRLRCDDVDAIGELAMWPMALGERFNEHTRD